MTLDQFINHIKHKSLMIDVFQCNNGCKQYYSGLIGSYLTSVVRSKIGSCRIEKIEPLVTSFNIFIEIED